MTIAHDTTWLPRPKLGRFWLFGTILCTVAVVLVLWAIPRQWHAVIAAWHALDKEQEVIQQNLLNDLSALPDKPLDTLEQNIYVLDQFMRLFVMNKIAVAYDVAQDSGVPIVTFDRIGRYQTAEITFLGDYYEQIYFLKKMDTHLSHFFLFHTVNGNTRGVIVKGRVYGE